jgi:hypothetical protein
MNRYESITGVFSEERGAINATVVYFTVLMQKIEKHTIVRDITIVASVRRGAKR